MSNPPISGGGSWSAHQALAEASRCMYCHDAPCVKGCPVQIDIPEFIRKIVTENYNGAARVVYEKNILGAVCADVCPEGELCAKDCNAARAGEPIRIGRLQKFAVMQGRQKHVTVNLAQGKRVAVVGAGPAGLSGAHTLASMGYAVTVFEARAEAGGTVQWGIPHYRLESSVLQHDLVQIQKTVPDIRFGVAVGRDMAEDALLKEYDAVLLSCGLGDGKNLDIPGALLDGVVTAEQMLAEYNPKFKEGEIGAELAGISVVVIGGGNTAMDAACVAKRAGAEVTILYRRAQEEMTAWPEEYLAASKLGIEFRWRTAPLALLGEGRVTAVRASKMQPCLAGDYAGLLEPITDSEFDLDAELVVVAIGQRKNSLAQALVGQPKVFLAGDVANDGATVVQAVAEGHQAALSIDSFLSAAIALGEGNQP